MPLKQLADNNVQKDLYEIFIDIDILLLGLDADYGQV